MHPPRGYIVAVVPGNPANKKAPPIYSKRFTTSHEPRTSGEAEVVRLLELDPAAGAADADAVRARAMNRAPHSRQFWLTARCIGEMPERHSVQRDVLSGFIPEIDPLAGELCWREAGTWGLPIAVIAGKPAGIVATGAALAAGLHLPREVTWRELIVVICRRRRFQYRAVPLHGAGLGVPPPKSNVHSRAPA